MHYQLPPLYLKSLEGTLKSIPSQANKNQSYQKPSDSPMVCCISISLRENFLVYFGVLAVSTGLDSSET